MGYHPLENCYGYMYAQGIIEKPEVKVQKENALLRTIPKEI